MRTIRPLRDSKKSKNVFFKEIWNNNKKAHGRAQKGVKICFYIGYCATSLRKTKQIYSDYFLDRNLLDCWNPDKIYFFKGRKGRQKHRSQTISRGLKHPVLYNFLKWRKIFMSSKILISIIIIKHQNPKQNQ